MQLLKLQNVWRLSKTKKSESRLADNHPKIFISICTFFFILFIVYILFILVAILVLLRRFSFDYAKVWEGQAVNAVVLLATVYNVWSCLVVPAFANITADFIFLSRGLGGQSG